MKNNTKRKDTDKIYTIEQIFQMISLLISILEQYLLGDIETKENEATDLNLYV